jgi:hypothetical protein
VWSVPRLCRLYALAFALQLRKKHGKPSVRVAARTSQADTVQYIEEKQYHRVVRCHRTIKNTEYTTEKQSITGK